MTMCKGALPLKSLSQICLMFEILISLTYSGVFVILESNVWFVMMLVFMAEAGLACIHIMDVYERTTLGMVTSRFLFVACGQSCILFFLLFQEVLIDKMYRGTGISYHYWLLKVIFDIPITYFTWSYYRHKYDMQ